MPLFKKKSITIEAQEYDGSYETGMRIMRWVREGGHECSYAQGDRGNQLIIETYEGDMRANPGDWIIKGVHGEFYPCKPGIFAETYLRDDDGLARDEYGEFGEDLRALLNKHSIDAVVNVPDHILAGYVKNSLNNLKSLKTEELKWRKN